MNDNMNDYVVQEIHDIRQSPSHLIMTQVSDLVKKMYEQGWNDAMSTQQNPVQLELVQEQHRRKKNKAVLHEEVVLRIIMKSGENGMTSADVAASLNLERERAAPIMSKLHMQGKIDRLRVTRKCGKVYVHPLMVEGRETAPYKARRP